MLSRLKEGLLCALLLALSITFLLPSTLYAGGGAAATGLPFGIFCLLAGGFAVLLAIILSAAHALLGARFDLRLVYLALAIAIVVKAVFLPSAVPVLDGEAEFANTLSPSGLWSIATMVLALALGAFVAYRFKLQFAGLLTMVVAVLALQPLLDGENRRDAFGGEPIESSAFFEFSRTQPNVLIVLIDTFQGDVFAELVHSDRSLRNEFAGFTYFHNTLATAPYTRMALMPIYSGRTYDGGSIRDYYRGARTDSLFTDFEARGYATALGGFQYGCVAQSCFPQASLHEDPPLLSALAKYLQVYDYAVLRVVPSGAAQRWFYNGDSGRLRQLVNLPEVDTPAGWSAAAIRTFSNRITTTSESPTLKFFHLMSAHSPVTLDSACRNIGEQEITREAYRAQAECALDGLVDLLRAMRSRGIYDNTTIVVISDHGASISGEPDSVQFLDSVQPLTAKYGGRLNALYLVKPAGERGPLELSAAPNLNSDLRATLCDIVLECADAPPGVSSFRPQANRMRSLMDYGGWVHRFTGQHDRLPQHGVVGFEIGPATDALRSTYDPGRRRRAEQEAERRGEN